MYPGVSQLDFGLFELGAVPVFLDPGMGIRRMVACFRESNPTAFIGIPKAHVLRVLYPKFFRSVQIWITAGRRWLWGGHTLKGIRQASSDAFPLAGTTRDAIDTVVEVGRPKVL